MLGQPLAFPGKGGEGTQPHSCTLRRPCKTQAAQSWLSQPPSPIISARVQGPGVLRAPENPWTKARATRNLALMGPELGSLGTNLDVPSMSRGPSASPLLPEHAIHAPGLLSQPFSSRKLVLCPAFPQLQRRLSPPYDSADHPIPSFPQGDPMGMLMRLVKGPVATRAVATLRAAQSGRSPELAKMTSALGGTPLGAACPGLSVALHPLLGAPQELGEGLRWKLRWSMTGRCGEAGQFTSSWIPLGLSPGRDPMPPKSSLRLPGRCWGQGDPPLMGHRHPASRGRASLEEGLGREHTAPPSPSPERERVAETDKDTDPQNTLWEAHPEPVLSSQTWILPGG